MAFILTAALLTASSLALPPAPANPAPIATPACPRARYADAGELLEALPKAGYECAEQLAAALRPRADLATADALLALALGGPDTRARRNGLRALGRLAEAPRGSRARELALRARGAAFRGAAAATLARERDSFLLQDAIWAVDSLFYPSLGAAAALERIADDQEISPAARERAARARARLVYARAGPLIGADRAFILGGLGSDSPGARAWAADAVARLRSDQLSPPLRAELAGALARAWAAEPPLALPAEVPDQRGAALLSFSESSATSLTARAAIARARDRLDGGSAHSAALRVAFEALALPHTLAQGDVTIRAGLPPGELPALLDLLGRARATAMHIGGPELATPIPGEARPLTVLVFPSQAAFRDYMRAFTSLSVDVDGVYDAAAATIYTHQRDAAQSENSLAESLLHELAHHLAAGHIFPGGWATPGYHAEPKGWADEGLAEALAGLGADGALAPRPAQLARLCAQVAPPALAALLDRRTGYDRFGRFDYDGAWALSYHLLTARPDAARRLYAAFRAGAYRRADWAALAGVGDMAAFEAEWHSAISRWCASS
jgi:hypothetical protein